MNVYNVSSIIEINKGGIIYIDSTGNRQYIDFYLCRSNWVKHVNDSKDFITWDGEPYNNINENDTNCVGQRDWFAERPYFEFFTTPLIRFELEPKRKLWDIFNKHWMQRYYPAFYGIQKRIIDAGWSTFDLG